MSRRALSVFSLVAIGMAVGPSAMAGKLYKWVDEKGRVHYSEQMPPEMVNRASTVLDKRGRIVRRNDAVSAEGTAQPTTQELARKRADEKRALEQARRDRAIMATYTSESEIDLARDRALATPTQALKGLEPRLKIAVERVDGFRKQQQAHVKAGKPVPDGLAEDLARAQGDLERLRAEYRAKEAEIEQIRAKYDADRERFRELSTSEAS